MNAKNLRQVHGEAGAVPGWPLPHALELVVAAGRYGMSFRMVKGPIAPVTVLNQETSIGSEL